MKIAGNDSSPTYVCSLALAGGAGQTTVWTGLLNPAGCDVQITRAWIRVTTASTGASTVDVGIGATIATAGDTLLDGISLASTGFKDSFNDTDNGTNGVAKPQVWAAGEYVTVGEASGDVAGLVGTLYIEYTYL